MGYKLNEHTASLIEECLGSEVVGYINQELFKASDETPLTVAINVVAGYNDKTRSIGSMSMRFSVLTELDKIEMLEFGKWYDSNQPLVFNEDARGHIILFRIGNDDLTARVIDAVTNNGTSIIDTDLDRHNLSDYEQFMVIK